jgi:hypothetical protein
MHNLRYNIIIKYKECPRCNIQRPKKEIKTCTYTGDTTCETCCDKCSFHGSAPCLQRAAAIRESIQEFR